jgi:hypothetical protein
MHSWYSIAYCIQSTIRLGCGDPNLLVSDKRKSNHLRMKPLVLDITSNTLFQDPRVCMSLTLSDTNPQPYKFNEDHIIISCLLKPILNENSSISSCIESVTIILVVSQNIFSFQCYAIDGIDNSSSLFDIRVFCSWDPSIFKWSFS